MHRSAARRGRVLLAGLPPAERRDALDHVGPLERLTGRTITDRGRLEEVLDQVAEQGYALHEGELDEGLRSIAVPVHDRDRKVVAAVNAAMHNSRRTPEECTTELLPQLRATAARIETEFATATRFVKIPVT
ncbi:IclR family transcriptional regulator C-terminal domain-containing protein [Streptomyces sp. R11]|uniref:IclR family transcriptional regulator C-terminal domain-containing protein n=1 Tax=Streptomyces sp. R11 TaxID=3238625 RepID=A0AB39NBE9_9ACTN